MEIQVSIALKRGKDVFNFDSGFLELPEKMTLGAAARFALKQAMERMCRVLDTFTKPQKPRRKD